MPNIKHQLQHNLHQLYLSGKGVKHADDPKHLYIHSTLTLNLYLHIVARFAVWLLSQGVKSRCTEAEAAAYIQPYIDFLIAAGYSANTIHVYAAAVCKALHKHLGDYAKPKRSSPPKKGRDTAASKEYEKIPKYQRIVAFAKAVGIRRSEYCDLTGQDFEVSDGVCFVIVRRGKGGKYHRQRITPENAALVASYFESVGPNEKLFLPHELSGKINFHAFRRELAQQEYAKLVHMLENDPTLREKLLEEIKVAFTSAGESWRRNRDMQLIDVPYQTRGNVRQRFLELGLPTKYDRLVIMYISVFYLSHWRAPVTVKHYMV